jgi:carbamoyltransferase
VAIFSGRAEGGPRALGNRSILFDPRNPKGKDIVNTVKGREWFRPFAGSILEEHADEWFEMAGLKDSPYMMYAIPVKEEKLHQIPAITHVDGTCRIQTVNDSDNLHYRELIKSFYAKTGVPILFNTSFNLAGHPLVEVVKDAIDTMKNSDIRYLYLPEIKKLVYKD